MSAEAESERLQFTSPGANTSKIWGGTIASAATIAPTHLMHVVSGTTEITTITLPYSDFSGILIFIPSGAFTLNTGGNIGKAATAVAGKAMIMVYSPATGLWYPSYVS